MLLQLEVLSPLAAVVRVQCVQGVVCETLRLKKIQEILRKRLK